MIESEEVKGTKKLAGVMQWLAWVVFIGIAVFYFGELLGFQNNPNQNITTQRNMHNQLEVVLQRNRHGHYVTNGKINGRTVTFFVDTGATGLAIPEKVARELGLRRGQPFKTYTANGTSTSYAVLLDVVSVGEIEQRDVQAAIAPGLQGDQILLGMSFLKHIEFTQRGDTLILRQ